jgi:hypothetical protein
VARRQQAGAAKAKVRKQSQERVQMVANASNAHARTDQGAAAAA